MADKENFFLYSSEQVSGGHPDKLCDYISDSILDAYLTIDPYAMVACETLVKQHHIIVAGEISSIGSINYNDVIIQACKDIGYEKINGYDLDKV